MLAEKRQCNKLKINIKAASVISTENFQKNLLMCINYTFNFRNLTVLKLHTMSITNKGNKYNITIVLSIALPLGLFFYMNNQQKERDLKHKEEMTALEKKFENSKKEDENRIQSLNNSLENANEQARRNKAEADNWQAKLMGATAQVQQLEKFIHENPTAADMQDYQIKLAAALNEVETNKTLYAASQTRADSLQRYANDLNAELYLVKQERDNFKDSFAIAQTRMEDLRQEMDGKMAIQKSSYERTIEQLQEAFVQEISADRLGRRYKSDKFDAYTRAKNILVRIQEGQEMNYAGLQESIQRLDVKIEEARP
jgi:hypothetical protein